MHLNIPILIFCKNEIKIYCKVHHHILFGLKLDFLIFLKKALVIVIPFLPFKGITHACLLKISITHNKKRIPF